MEHLQLFRLIQLQTAELFFPAVVGLCGDLRFLAGLRGGLSVRDLHFKLPQKHQDLLRLVSLNRHDRSSSYVDSVPLHLVQKTPGQFTRGRTHVFFRL
jgi:hypothetical protein